MPLSTFSPRRRRAVLAGILVTLVLVACTALILMVTQYGELREFRQDVYQRCLARQAYDDGANTFRDAIVAQNRPHRDAASQRVVAAGQAANRKALARGCERYKP